MTTKSKSSVGVFYILFSICALLIIIQHYALAIINNDNSYQYIRISETVDVITFRQEISADSTIKQQTYRFPKCTSMEMTIKNI